MARRLVREAEGELGPFEVREVDIGEHPEAVRAYGVLTTPALVIDGRLEFSGVPERERLLERLREVKGQGS